MALNWNQLQSYRNARDQVLAGNSVDSTPNQTTQLGTVSKIELAVQEEALPVWRIPGVASVEVDAVSGKPPAPAPKPPLWPSQPRPEAFPVKYEDLNQVLDAEFIVDEGLVEIDPGSGVYEEA